MTADAEPRAGDADRPEVVAYQQGAYFVVQTVNEPKQALASDLTVVVDR